MAQGYQVLEMLLPQGGWIIKGEDYKDITWVDNRPKCTKAEYEAGFTKYDALKTAQDAAKAQAKTAAEGKLASLGLTTDDLRALGL